MPAGRFNYTEAFVGLHAADVSGRLYFSPNYFGEQASTVYAEVNSSYQLRDRLRLLGHVGVLHFLTAKEATARPASRLDLRIGANAGLGDWNVQVAWVATNRNHGNAALYEKMNSTWVLSASYAF